MADTTVVITNVIAGILLSLFFLLVLYLTVRMLLFTPPQYGKTIEHPVSVIIPFRNEEKNLPRVLESLAAQEYEGVVEIILVNDQSSDNYLSAVNSFKEEHPDFPVTVINSEYDSQTDLTSKQQALDRGVAHASYDWIACTDADMLLYPYWLSSLIKPVGNGISLVYGHTVMHKDKKTLFNLFQSYQLEFLFATAYAFYTAGLRGSCMGNNLLFSKKMYQDIGGQKTIGYSIVEDLDLLKTALKMNFRAAPVIPFFPTAETQPCSTLNQLFHQVLRWLKGGLKQQYALLPVLFLLGCQNIFLILSLCGFFNIPVLCLSLINILMLALFTGISFRKIGSKHSVLFFPLYYLLMTIQTIIMIFPVMAVSPVWKKRQI